MDQLQDPVRDPVYLMNFTCVTQLLKNFICMLIVLYCNTYCLLEALK